MLSTNIRALLALSSMAVAALPNGAVGGDLGALGAPDNSGPTKASPKVLQKKNAIAGQYIVVLKDSTVKARAAGSSQADVADAVTTLAHSLANQYGGTVTTTWNAALRGFALRATAQAAEALAADPSVALVEQDGVVKAITNQTPATWGLDRIDQRNLPLNNTYGYNTTAANVTAYVIDTGIRITHSEFGGRASWGTNTADSNNTDCHGHGTHVAGTIGGSTYGVAKAVKLKAVKVLDCSGSGSDTGVISGIDWVTANKVKPAVANMSLGGSYSAALNQAVANSIAAGITYAIAAGNDNANACNYSPSSTPTAITVGATDSTDSRAYYSNYGNCLDIFAPGSLITSSWNSSDSATNTISGTSMATPHVAGVAALYLATNTAATAAQVAQALTSSATPSKVANPGTGSPNLLLYSYVAPPDTTPPTAALTAPTSGQTLSGTFTLTANATDNVAVTKVEFYADYNGGTLLGSATTSPYQASFNSATLPNGTYSFTAKATDSSGNATTSAAVSAKIANTGTCTNSSQLALNTGFESGPVNWASSRGAIWYVGSALAHAGNWAAWLDGYGSSHTDDVYQDIAIPANVCSATLNFWLKINTAETTTNTAYDTLSVTVRNTSGTVLKTLVTYSNLNKSASYALKTFDLTAYKGQTIRVQFHGVEDSDAATSFYVDDATLATRY